jgi:ABC-type phosphate transport system substrate-binding protein
MTMMKFRMFGIALALALAIPGGLAIASSSAEAAGTPGTKLTATPHKSLKNGKKITIKGTGFVKNSTVYVLECATRKATSCDKTKITPVTTNAKGSFKTSYKVYTGKPCKKHKSCYIGASDALQMKKANVKITFK